MPVDKFGRKDDGIRTQGPVSVPDMDDTYLRRDGTNTAIGTINMTGSTLTNVSNPVFDHDVANKLYVDDKTRDSERDCASKVSKTGDIITGNIMISAEGNNDRVLGCTDLAVGRAFSIPLGTNTNLLSFIYQRNPVVLETDFGFTVKARNELVCELGSTHEPMEITLYKNVRMNSNRITNLLPPELAHEAANKLYVDRKARKILQGYIPNLRSSSEFGFVVTASSHLSNFFRPLYAFNGVYARGGGVKGEWASNGETRNFWIQIKCPDLVWLWKIALRGRDTNSQRIYSWRLEGSTDGGSYTTLLEPSNPSYIGNELEYYLIDTTNRFNIFRLYCLEAEPTNPGLSYMQLYVHSE